MAKSKLKLTAEEKERINVFVDTFPAPFTRQQYGHRINSGGEGAGPGARLARAVRDK